MVTGSSGGIGHAIANEFAREGASVVINSRDAGRAESAASAMEHEGLRASGFAADIRDPKQARALAEAAVERYGRLDVWVNNAGVNVIKPALELEPEEWAQVIDTNLSACFYGAQAAARLMVPQKSGVIIQIGSIIGEVGLPRRVPYTAAKHGLIGLTKVLATVSTGLGIKSQTRGGAFSTADIERRTPMGRFGEAVEVARVAVFLASDDASYITGSHITVDGGWVAYGGW